MEGGFSSLRNYTSPASHVTTGFFLLHNTPPRIQKPMAGQLVCVSQTTLVNSSHQNQVAWCQNSLDIPFTDRATLKLAVYQKGRPKEGAELPSLENHSVRPAGQPGTLREWSLSALPFVKDIVNFLFPK